MGDVIGGVLLPAVIAGAVLFIVQRFGGSDWRERWAGPLAFLAGLGFAYAMFDWVPWEPEYSWQWLPYVTLLGGVAAVILGVPGLKWFDRFVLLAAVASVAAWAVVPDWEKLDPRWRYCAGLAGSLLILNVAYEPLDGKARGSGLWCLQWSLISLGAAVVLFQSGTAKYAQLAAAQAAALAGCGIASWRQGRESAFGGTTPIVVHLGGLLFTGAVGTFSEVPKWCFAGVLMSPLVIWIFAWGPQRRWMERWPVMVTTLAVLIPLGISVGVALSTEKPEW